MTAFDRPHLFAYTLPSGAPVRTHTATVDSAQQGMRTALSCQVESIPEPPVPNTVWSALVRPVINQLLKGVSHRNGRPDRRGLMSERPATGPRPKTTVGRKTGCLALTGVFTTVKI